MQVSSLKPIRIKRESYRGVLRKPRGREVRSNPRNQNEILKND